MPLHFSHFRRLILSLLPFFDKCFIIIKRRRIINGSLKKGGAMEARQELWYGAVFKDNAGFFEAFREGELPQGGKAKRITCFSGDFEEVLKKTEEEMEKLRKSN